MNNVWTFEFSATFLGPQILTSYSHLNVKCCYLDDGAWTAFGGGVTAVVVGGGTFVGGGGGIVPTAGDVITGGIIGIIAGNMESVCSLTHLVKESICFGQKTVFYCVFGVMI